jgi:protein-tyrosine phosphatase
MGNICRSPTAEGVFRKLVREAGLEDSVQIASAGTHAYHVGEAPDLRAQQAALKRGYDLGSLKARQVTQDDFNEYDLILAMDRDNLRQLEERCPAGSPSRIELFLGDREVPDPYYGEADGFGVMMDQIEAGARRLLTTLGVEQ